MKKNMLFVTIGVVVALVGALAVSAVSAQTDTPPNGDRPDLGIREAVNAAVADALGMTVDELQAAHEDGQRLPEIAEAQGVDLDVVKAAAEAAKEEAVNAAVADGTLTQEQADRILSHEGRPGRGPEGPNGRRGNPEALAEALGMTVEELQAAKAEGLTLEELAAQQGTTVEDVHAALQAAREEAIQQAVEEGRLTQEQADAILNGERPSPGSGFGPGGVGHGPGGFGGPRSGGPPSSGQGFGPGGIGRGPRGGFGPGNPPGGAEAGQPGFFFGGPDA
ncbi:MAG: hypothetical protein ACE5FI_17490 [Anaerolineales bacterium]